MRSNFVTFLNGLVEMYLPGVVASTFHAFQLAYDKNDWGERQGFPSPNNMGVHSAEFLSYRTRGRLGVHVDSDTLITISVALSSYDSHEGGYFRLATKEAMFKVPKRSAVVFFGQSFHGITDIVKGDRTAFVVEIWDDDDVPVGHPRPDALEFQEYKAERTKALESGQVDGCEALEDGSGLVPETASGI